jgi:N-acetylneuraminic acid mutarotase
MMRDRLGLAGVMLVAVLASGCASSAATPTIGPSLSPTVGPSLSPSAAATATPVPTPTPSGVHWAPAGLLSQDHAQSHLLLLTGGQAIVVGNDNFCAPGPPFEDTEVTEIWNATNSTWAKTGSLNAPRSFFAAESLDNGKGLVIGGVNDEWLSYSSTKLYDPATGTWSSTGLMATARTDLASARLDDGVRVMAIGGEYDGGGSPAYLKTVEIYDQSTGKWSATGSLLKARTQAKAVTLSGGRVLIVGGTDGTNPLASAELWDPATGKWSAAGSLAKYREGFSLVALPDGSALVAGGFDPATVPTVAVASAERFDPGTLTWKSAGTMKKAAGNRIAVVMADGKVLLAGGMAGDWSPAISDAEIYDPALGTWTATVSMPATRERAGAVLLSDGSILVVGGDGGFIGEPSTPWCPDQRLETIRYVPAVP